MQLEQIDFYTYNATVMDVYDGDTITVDIDLGFNVTLRNQKIRLYSIDTPEVRGDSRISGIAARDWVRSELLNKRVVLNSIKDKSEKYGRWLGIILYTNDSVNEQNNELLNLNQRLIEFGFAKNYDI